LTESLKQIDVDVFRALNLAGSNEILDAIMILLTVLGFTYVITLLSVPLWLSKKREAAVDLVFLVIVVSVVTELVKILVDRQRPYLELSGVQRPLVPERPCLSSLCRGIPAVDEHEEVFRFLGIHRGGVDCH
jgi:membrane-associated phospholipid phosphatase